MPEVLMPRLSDATTEATIVAWLVPDGALVRIGDEVVEIETDKATTAWPADAEGVLSIAVPAGRTVCPGTAIARIGDAVRPSPVAALALDGDAPDDGAPTPDAEAGPTADGPTQAGPTADGPTQAGPTADGPTQAGPTADGQTADGQTADGQTADGQTEAGPKEAEDVAPAAPDPGPSSALRHDAAAAAAAAGEEPTARDAAPAGDRAAILRDPTRIERLVSERMVQSRTEIPEFTVSVDVDLAAALALRGDLKAVGAPGGGGRTPSVNDLLVKASALALVDHPRVRSAWTADGVLQHERIDVGVAVATDDGGLVVPVVRDADRLGLAALAAQTRELTGRARQGRITPAEMSGATFTISNLGAMGVSHFTAIIGPGQGAILAVGAAIDRFVPVDGAPVLRPICTVTLTCDHRVVYGAHGAAFLERLRTILEHPGALAF
jgi:pyruvate dehydrogenase E2 component (dihydrolipoamide acetyltransferase)